MIRSTYGKFRAYACPCGAEPHRPLAGDPRPCDRCGAALAGVPSVVEDAVVWARRLLSERRLPPGSEGER